MDLFEFLTDARNEPIRCIDMHTSGEPTRIVVSGYPNLTGTLLEQRAQASTEHDNIRQQLMFEPRGHAEMYGAILRQKTELTETGQAHIGVLFTTKDDYSTMCGHATIALGRFLVDTHDLNVFPARNILVVVKDDQTIRIKLHAPCGVVQVVVPVNEDGSRSDPSRPVFFESVLSFATGINVSIPISEHHEWPELGNRTSVAADFAYGGAFYCFIQAKELGFPDGLGKPDIDAMNKATRLLKAAIIDNEELYSFYQHPYEKDLSFLYSVIIVDKELGKPVTGTGGAETGLCFFSDQQIDRSPTGSAVSARIALARAKKEIRSGQALTYHSLVTLQGQGNGSFVGTAYFDEPESKQAKFPILRTKVEGFAYYIGTHTFICEPDDPLKHGFQFPC